MKNHIALVVIALLAACGSPESKPAGGSTATTAAPPAAAPLPAAEQAREIIGNAPDFGEYQFTNAAVTLPMKQSAMNEPAREMAAALRSAKWIIFKGDDVVLGEKAKADKRFLVRPNGFVDIVPLAKKEMGNVEGVRRDPEGAAVDFTWRWVPNDIAAAFHEGPVHDRFSGEQRATATLIHDGTNWTVLRIVPRTP